MAECHKAAPPLYQTHPQRAVACYLFKDQPQVAGSAMAEVLAR
jgi:hypothetical protein